VRAGHSGGMWAIDPRHSSTAPDALTALALAYLALPNLIFLAGWLKPLPATAMVVLLMVSVLLFLRRPDVGWQMPYSRAALAAILIFAFIWSSLGGAGHFVNANHDWVMRDKVLGDLTFGAWPPSYGVTDGHHHILRTALGYFLPAAVLGKVFGIGAAELGLYVWTALGAGLFLLLLPLPRRAGWRLGAMLVVVVFFSGMDFLGVLLATGTLPVFPLRLEWWVPFSLPSPTGQLFWAPNHALPLWLAAVLFYRHWGHRSFPSLTVVLLPLLMIWTPFAVMAMLPFVAFALARWLRTEGSLRGMQIAPVQLLFAAILGYLTIRFLTLDIAAIPSAPTATALPEQGGMFLKYLLFLLMECLILALVLTRELRHSRGLLWLAVAILALLPVYRFGPSNDSLLRLSAPSLIFLLILTLDVLGARLDRAPGQVLRSRGWLLAAILLVGAATPFVEIWRALAFKRTLADYSRTVVEQNGGGDPPHYVGLLTRPDLIALLRPPAIVPGSSQRRDQSLLSGASSPK